MSAIYSEEPVRISSSSSQDDDLIKSYRSEAPGIIFAIYSTDRRRGKDVYDLLADDYGDKETPEDRKDHTFKLLEAAVKEDQPTPDENYEDVAETSKIPWLGFVGALITAGVLTAGLISFKQGNSQLGQTLMRARVVAQGGTVALMVGTAAYYGEKF
ncbi:hypothetical protein E3N88_24266 [Mikania micrantha]|uniref:HIG1 domain-containing protein n=1 Tax=Mikania micrantha TaxID=192012 RepID=A0A5N6NI54_9ASTR|nr:hypothetical protein E3N88_24266 [Mikania micrantha]